MSSRLRRAAARVVAGLLLASTLVTIAAPQAHATVAPAIKTFAGIGVGNGLTATSTLVANSFGVAVDSAGNIDFSDNFNGRIQQVNTSGIMTTVAGNGLFTVLGDGGLAINASTVGTAGVAVDSSNNIYFADSVNNRIREVTASTGIITTVAGNGTPSFSGDGGAATSATLSSPNAVAVDSSNNLYISDKGNNRIRKVSGGTITTVAGNGTAGYSGDGAGATAAKINTPYGVAVDSSGNIYIADKSNQRIRKVSGGNISTIAGTGTASFSGDGGAATSATLNSPIGVAVDGSGNVYIADYNNSRIRKITGTTISTIAGTTSAGFSGDGGAATSAKLNFPTAIALDTSGNVYIADNSNYRIRKITGTTISTVAGNGTTGYSGDGGTATSAELFEPSDAASDTAGNIYIADTSNNVIRKVTPAGTISTIAGTGVYGHAGDGGAAISATLEGPQAVAADAAGNIYIADSYSSLVRKVNPAGIISTFAGTGTGGNTGDGGAATSAKIFEIEGLAVDSAGNVYMSDTSSNVIRKVNTSGIISTVAGTGTAGFSGDNGAATSAQLNGQVNIALDGAGNLLVADDGNNRVRKITTGGIISTIAGSGVAGYTGDGGAATSARMTSPSGIASDALGNVYISDASGAVRMVDTSNVISTVAGTGTLHFSGDGGTATSAGIVGPDGLLIDTQGNLLITDYASNDIREVVLQTAANGSANASVTIDSSFTFTVGAHSGACNGAAQSGSATASTVALGHVGVATVATAAQDLTVGTNAGGGFTVYLRSSTATANQIMNDGASHYIVDSTGTNASPVALSAGTAAFGYTATGMTSNAYAKVPTSAGNDSVLTASAGTYTGTSCVGFGVAVSGTTRAASYSAIVIYTAVPVY